MSKFKFYFTMDCVSFTLLMLLFSFLSLFGLATVVIESVFILFLMTTCIAMIIFFTDKLPINEAPYVAVVLGMIAVVYFGTFGVLIIKARADAEDINRQIKKMKQERK